MIRTGWLISLMSFCLISSQIEAQNEFRVSEPVQVTIPEVKNVYNPRWSSDGHYLAFELIDKEARDLYIWAPDSLKLVKVFSHSPHRSNSHLWETDRNSSNFSLVWNPKNNKFVYVGSGEKGLYSLYLDTAAHPNQYGKRKDLLDNGFRSSSQHAMFPNYHPKENLVVFCQGSTEGRLFLKVVQVGGQCKVQNLLQKTMISATDAHFSPQSSDGLSTLAFVGGETGSNDIYALEIKDLSSGTIGTKTIKDMNLRCLVDWLSVESNPRWSPDGQQIAFLSSKDHDTEKDIASLYVMHADGSGVRKLADRVVKPEFSDYDTFVWHPNKPYLLFAKQSEGEANPICYINVQTGGESIRLETGTLLNSNLAISADGRKLAFCAQGKQGDKNLTWRKLYIVNLEPAR